MTSYCRLFAIQEHMLKLTEIRKDFSGVKILDIPSFGLQTGIYWLQGFNGSGKTTLMRMIAGICPFQGEIELNDISLHSYPLQYRKLVSWAAAEPLYPAHITGKEMIVFYKDVRKDENSHIDFLIEYFGVKDYIKNPMGTYSSGMNKRLSLLLAFIGKAPLILLDEPLATLDSGAAQFLPGLIKKYNKEYGVSFIFSSHQSIDAGLLQPDRKFLIEANTIHSAP